MAKVTNIWLQFRNREDRHKVDKDFHLVVNVTTAGEFTTTLPTELVSWLAEVGIGPQADRLGANGRITAMTLDGLKLALNKLKEAYETYEIVDERVVIGFDVQMFCAYVKGFDGKFYANGVGAPQSSDVAGCVWVEGTTPVMGGNRRPFGFSIHAQALTQKIIRYCDGKERTLFEFYVPKEGDDEYLVFLSRVMSYSGQRQIVDYTENVGKFFYNLYQAVFQMNEQIKDFLNVDGIKFLSEQAGKISLMGGDNGSNDKK